MLGSLVMLYCVTFSTTASTCVMLGKANSNIYWVYTVLSHMFGKEMLQF